MSTESTLKIIFGGASHRRTSGYGWRVHPTKKTKKFHYGVDYGCGKVAVHALESGTVYKRGYDKSAGNYVYVKYARYGVCVAYFHLSSISVKQGQAVSRGTRVGVAGSTGTSTGVHLHIGVRSLSSWKWQNPETWLANYSAPSSGGSSSGGSSGYRVGSTYTLRANMNVRTGPGTNYAKKKRSALTANARAHCTSSSSAVLKSGTRVTCKAVRTVGSDIWLQIPSGYVCARKSGKVYIS